MGKIRVLLADDNETIIARVYATLGTEFEIIGAVNNGRDAVAAVERLNPDVLVIDISMPVLDGLEAVSQLKRTQSQTKFVFLTVHQDQDFIDAAFSAGASGYVTKEDLSTDLCNAIIEARHGRTYISQSVVK